VLTAHKAQLAQAHKVQLEQMAHKAQLVMTELKEL
jgi:hypothetical protein